MRKNQSKYKNKEFLQLLIDNVTKFDNINFNYNYIDNGYAYFNCSEHGDFRKRLDHLQSITHHTCPKCSKQIYSKIVGKSISSKHTIDEYVDLNKYEPLEDYVNTSTKIKFRCKIHNKEFIASPNRCVGCEDCKYEHHYKWEKDWRHIDQDEIIRRCKEIHPEYDYSEVEYVNATTPITIICPTHGRFKMSYANLTNKSKPQSCPFCNSMKVTQKSKLSMEVTNRLDELNIIYETEKTFDGLHDKKKLRLDLYIPKYNTVIEIQGAQHFTFIKSFSKNESGFEYIKYHDKLKYEYCKSHNIKILYYTSIYNKDLIPTNYFDVVYTDIDELILQLTK